MASATDQGASFGDKKYGPHRFVESEGRCSCGCFEDASKSGGPLGIEPDGECPENPLNGSKLGNGNDYQLVATRNFRRLKEALAAAEEENRQLRLDLSQGEGGLGDRESLMADLGREAQTFARP